MNLPPFEYMEWAKSVPVGARFNLANSGVPSVERAEFDFEAADIQLMGPDPYGLAGLVERIAAHHEVDRDWVLPVPGTSLANFVVLAAAIDAGAEVLVEEPAYPILALLPAFFGATVRRFAFEEPEPVAPSTRLVIRSHLHNPTGSALTGDDFERLADLGVPVLVDEVYRDFLGPAAGPVAPRRGPDLISTGSLTKVYGLPGLRLGWILARPPWIERMRRVVDYLHVIDSFPSMSLGVLAFDRLDELWRRGDALCRAGREVLVAWLARHPEVACDLPPAGSIAFLRLPVDADPVVEAMLARDAAAVPGRFFGVPNGLRVSLTGGGPVVEGGLEILSDVLSRLG